MWNEKVSPLLAEKDMVSCVKKNSLYNGVERILHMTVASRLLQILSENKAPLK